VIRFAFAALSLALLVAASSCADPCNPSCQQGYVCQQEAASSEWQLTSPSHCVVDPNQDPNPWPLGADAGAVLVEADAGDAGEGGVP
jgi:hypothetical protein